MTILREILKKRIMLLDGAMGTTIQKLRLGAADFGGEGYEGCNEYLNLVKPEAIRKIYEDYLKAGSDIISTNTFGGTSVTLSEYGLGHMDYEINKAAAELGRKAIEKFTSAKKPRFLAGSIGPTNRTISVTCNISFEDLAEAYYRQAKALADGGIDIFLVETIFDTLNAKAAMNAIHRLFKERPALPIMLSTTIEQNGRMLAGQDIEAFCTSMEHHDLLAIGMNCATGPDLMRDHLRTCAGIARTNVFCYPNAGLPLEDGTFPLKPKEFARHMSEFADEGWLNLVGGCCGTTPEYIMELSKAIEGKKPRRIPSGRKARVSGSETLVAEEDNRPIIVGERTNVIGSRIFKDLISSENFDAASEIGIEQKRKGAQVLDVCLANPDRDEVADSIKFYDLITKKVRLPIMIDSTDPKVIEIALKRTQGKSIINSINFEDGTERIEKIMPLVKQYGASVIFGTIDEDKEQAMALTAERKLSIAKRAAEYLKKEWDFGEENIIFDSLVFPVATGDEKYKDTAKPTLDAISRIKKELKGAKTILGVSNVSFGLPPSGREVLNSVYLYHATKAGLDYAIVNSEKLMRYPSISEEEKKLAEDLLFWNVKDPITPFSDFYRGKKAATQDMDKLPLNERLKRYIMEGRKDGLIGDLEKARETMKPMDIINGPLIEGMGVVGKLFSENKLIVSEVLQSAESMKAAVSHLENFMHGTDKVNKGKVIIATVKGDVHDIGKNLLEIILKNNGYEVINLGIKVPPEVLISEYRKHKPDVMGLSGLLVKSAQMMVTTAEDFRAAKMDVPLVVGGAALTRKFTSLKIQPAYGNIVAYANNAMEGLKVIGEILKDPQAYNKLQPEFVEEENEAKEESSEVRTERSTFVEETKVKAAPDFKEHIIKDYSLDEVFSYINPIMLYNKHLGLKGHLSALIAKGNERAIKLKQQVDDVKAYAIHNRLIKPKAVYRFFECKSEKNSILIYDKGKEIERLEFPRQKQDEFLSVPDFVSSRETDSMALFVTCCGEGILNKCTELREKGEYLKSHMLQVLAIESAEAFAEIVHRKIRESWGIPDKDISMEDIFKAKYTGIRLSYGYPACPNLDDQQKLFKLLKPEQIGVYLTEGMMMDPEASVSALVFHHPQAKYFRV
ncbi:methionine synthase [Candidatus Woesearchaeota archaeon]|nr:methionine synthase [Candidatus Woesearchaeota archaeon]